MKEAIALLKEVIILLKEVESNFTSIYNGIAPTAIYDGGNRFADKDETVIKIREFLNENDKSDYITIYESISGWTSVHIYWNPDGFWEPWSTGFGKYATSGEAEQEAQDWAKAEGIRYVRPKDLTQK